MKKFMSDYSVYIVGGLIILFFGWKFWVNNQANGAIGILVAENKKIFLVDVRQPGEYASGSVEGAINIPLGEVANRINEFKNKEHIVVFCQSGARSSQASSILKNNGIENVINGGGWQNVAKAINR
jgi:phage shock protein E